MARDAAMYNLCDVTNQDSARFALFDKITPQQFDDLEMDTRWRIVPTMGQHGWLLEEAGLRWSRRSPLKEAE